MTIASSNRRTTLRACALLVAIVAAPAACTLDLAGKPPGGADGSASASSSTSSAPSTSTSTSTGGGGGAGATTSASGSAGTGGAPTFCEPNAVVSCYDGPPKTENIGACKDGTHTCLPDGSAFGACANQIKPAAEDCLEPADEDCDGKANACLGTTLGGAAIGKAATDEVLFAVAADLAGNLFIGGVGGATPPDGGIFAVTSGSGGIGKVLPNGTLSWAVSMSTVVAKGYSVVRGLATDSLGNVLVIGELQGTTSGGAINVPGLGGIDVFVAKLDTTGKTLWAKSFGNAADQYGYSVAVDGMDNVLITGRTVGAVDFGGGAPGVSAGVGDNVFVAKLDSLGNHLWSKVFGDDSVQIGNSVAATPDGDVVVAGELAGAMDFGGGKVVTSAGGKDIFVARLAGATGAAIWANRYGDDNDQVANGVVVGPDGGVVLTGSMVGKVNFGGIDHDANGKANVFVAKLHSDGTYDWSHDYGDDADNQVGLAISVDPAKNIVVVGYFKGTISFGATTLTDVSNSKSTNVFVAKLSAAGGPVWAYRFGDTNDATLWAVATDAKSNVLLGGTFDGVLDLPPMITALSSYDGFWARLAP